MTFYDRVDELAVLSDAFESPGHDFVVLYGRRRIGKTALIRAFCAERPHLYYLATPESPKRQREKFVRRVAERWNERPPQIDGWPEALAYLGEKLTEERVVIAIDEFPYLVDSDEALPSYVQELVDDQLPESDSMLLLCGSSVSVMESDVLGSESPLYGRRTAQIDLQPFSFSQAREAINYELQESIRSFAITGGTPMYLNQFDYGRPIAENVREAILERTAVLYSEPEFLLRTELRNPARYMSILEAIATGHTTPNEISGTADIDPGPLSSYLKTLRRLRLIERTVPVTAVRKKTKRSRYRIGDEFLRFWFRYVEPHRSSIEHAPDLVFDDVIRPDLPHHVAVTFEDICREAVWEAVRQGQLDRYASVGPWWYGEDELDIVALGPEGERIFFGECKWTNEPVGHDVVENLLETAQNVRWGPRDRDEQYGLFAKAGFVDDLLASLDHRWHLYSVDDLDSLLQPS